MKKIITVINEHDVLISGYQKLFPFWQILFFSFYLPLRRVKTHSESCCQLELEMAFNSPMLSSSSSLEIFFRIIIYNEEFRVLEEYKLNFSNGVLDLVISVLAPWHLPISQQARPTPHTPEPSLYEAHTSTCRNVMMGPTQAHI